MELGGAGVLTKSRYCPVSSLWRMGAGEHTVTSCEPSAEVSQCCDDDCALYGLAKENMAEQNERGRDSAPALSKNVSLDDTEDEDIDRANAARP